MPEAPPRQVSESRERDDSWKDANRPRAREAQGKRSSALPVMVLFVAAVSAGVVFRADVLRFLSAHGVPVQGAGATVATTGGANVAGATVTLATNIAVDVEINGEVVGRTPIRSYPVKPGNVAVHYFDPAQGIDKTVSYAVQDGEAFTKHEDFDITRVQFKNDKAIQADVYLNGKRIGQTGSAPIPIAAGEYDFEAKADNGTLTGTAHATLSKTERINFVEFKLHRK
jgi:hypothetical protein